MAYSEELAARIRDVFGADPQQTERKMFGGLCFMVGGHMACGVVGDELMVRVGPEGYEAALRHPHAREMDFTGRPLKGMIYVGVEGLVDREDLAYWVEQGASFCRSLPPKDRSSSKRPG